MADPVKPVEQPASIQPVAPPPEQAKPTPDPEPPKAPVEGKPAEEPKPAEGEPKKVEGEPKKEEPVVPEKYDLKLPAGSLLDPARVEKISLYAKENKLSNEQAQKILERESDAQLDFLRRQNEELKAKAEQWIADVASDPELGGDNSKEKIEIAHRNIKRHASPAFQQILSSTGVGNHPEFLRYAYKNGLRDGEDKLVVPGSQPAGGFVDPADILYPKKQ